MYHCFYFSHTIILLYSCLFLLYLILLCAAISSPTDVVLLVDASTTSFTAQDFSDLRQGLISLTNQFVISNNYVHVSLVTFSDNPRIEFFLNSATASSWQSVQSYIQNNMQQHSSGTNDYSAALRYVQDTVLTTGNGKRQYVPVSVILIVGTASSNSAQATQAANRLKATGAYIVTVGITNRGSGPAYSQAELSQIASSPIWLTTVSVASSLSSQVATIATNAAPPNRPPSKCVFNFYCIVVSILMYNY